MERNNTFWNSQEAKIGSLQKKWFQEEILKDEESMKVRRGMTHVKTKT